MNDDDLQRLWQRAPAATPIIQQKETLMQDLQARLEREQTQLRRRNHREIAAAVVVGLAFGAAGYTADHWATQTGAALLVAYALLVPVILQRTARRRPCPGQSQSLVAHLEAGKTYLQYERRLTRRVLYWYLLPPYAGLAFFWAGMEMPWSIYGMFMLGLTALYGYIFQQNQKAVREEFDPLIEELETTLDELKAS